MSDGSLVRPVFPDLIKMDGTLFVWVAGLVLALLLFAFTWHRCRRKKRSCYKHETCNYAGTRSLVTGMQCPSTPAVPPLATLTKGTFFDQKQHTWRGHDFVSISFEWRSSSPEFPPIVRRVYVYVPAGSSSKEVLLYAQPEGERGLSGSWNGKGYVKDHSEPMLRVLWYLLRRGIVIVAVEPCPDDTYYSFPDLLPGGLECTAALNTAELDMCWDGKRGHVYEQNFWREAVSTLRDEHGIEMQSCVLLGYSAGGHMVSRAMESFPDMYDSAHRPFPRIRAGAITNAGSMSCYAYKNVAWPPEPFLPCISLQTQCCPHGLTEPAYDSGDREGQSHPPVALFQTFADSFADPQAAQSYYDAGCNLGFPLLLVYACCDQHSLVEAQVEPLAGFLLEQFDTES